MALLVGQGFGDPARIGSASFTSQILNVSLPNIRLIFETWHSPPYIALVFHLWTAHISGSRGHSCGILNPEEQGHPSVGFHLLQQVSSSTGKFVGVHPWERLEPLMEAVLLNQLCRAAWSLLFNFPSQSRMTSQKD